MENFGKVIKKKREKKNWNQKELAEQLHVSPKSVSRWETDHGYPDIALLPTLAKVLELDYHELLDGNEYIIHQREKKIRRIKIGIIFLICIVLVAGLLLFLSNSPKEEFSYRDLLAKEQWGHIHSIKADDFYFLEEDQKDYVLDSLLFDEWQEVKMKESKKIQLIQSEIINDQKWCVLIPVQDVIVQLSYYEYNEKYFITLSDSSGDYELYEMHQAVNNPLIIIQEDMKNWFGFVQNHSIQSNTKELTVQEAQLIPLEYSLNKEDFLLHHYTFIEDQDNQRYYFIICSDDYDYQTIDMKVNYGNLSVELSGQKYAYQTPYIHIFEIDEQCFDISIQLNGEEVSVMDIYHTVYSAKEINTFE